MRKARALGKAGALRNEDAMRQLRILMVHGALEHSAEADSHLHDLAVGLLTCGHRPIVHSRELRRAAEELRRAGVPVTDRPEALSAAPDLIQGDDPVEMMIALLHFPNTPAVYFCHASNPWGDLPPLFPRIGCYVAVDSACIDRLVGEAGIPQERTRLLPAFVDVERFPVRKPLPSRPARAVLVKESIEDAAAPAISEACQRLGIALDVVDRVVTSACTTCAVTLSDYDLVFASGRPALDAMAAGAAVILCGDRRWGPIVTRAEFDALHKQNFRPRLWCRPLAVDDVVSQIQRYSAEDTAAVTAHLRTVAGRDGAIDELLRVYDEVLASPLAADNAARDAEARALAAYVEALAPRSREKSATHLRRECEKLRSDYDRACAERDCLRTERDELLIRCERVQQLRDYFQFEHEAIRPERDHYRRECDRLNSEREGLQNLVQSLRDECTNARVRFQAELDQITADRDRLEKERGRLDVALHAVYGSLAMRTRDRLLAAPVIGSATRLAARRVRALKRWFSRKARP